MKEKTEKFTKYLLITLLIIMPILDMRFFFSRVTTLTEVLIILFCLLLTLITNKTSRKSFIKLFIYYCICLIYLIINYYRSSNFISYYENNFNYSLYRETLTIIKLMMPITLYFILKHMNINKRIYNNIILYWSIFISSSIIITDIFKIGYSSYGDQIITYNIFGWKKNIYYIYTACKGFFNYANQESCVLLMLLIINIYNYIYNNKKNIVIIFLLSISMIILGTRTSTIGGLLLFVFLIIFSIIYNLIKKVKIKNRIVFLTIPVVLWILIIPISPYKNRNLELNIDRDSTGIKNIKDEKIITNENSKVKKETETSKDVEVEKTKEDLLREYFDSYVNNDVLPEMFYKNYYSYYNDPEFWVDFIKKNNVNGINYRLIEISIIKRVKEVNNNKYDTLFGISNSRIQNIVNIERDFVLHYYAYGIIGSLILLSPYIYLLFNLIILCIKKRKINYIYILGVLSIYILSCVLTGNILNYLTCSVPLIFIYNGINIKKNNISY